MNIEYIEDLIEKENINLIETYLENAQGCYVNYYKLNLILYDNSKITNTNERKQVFAEELGHYYYDATYKFNSSLQLVSKQEYRAKKWSYYTLVPFQKLKSAVSNGIDTVYNLAEYFEVTEEYMQKAIKFYKEKYELVY